MGKNQDLDYIAMNKNAYNDVADLFSSTREYLWDDLKSLGKYVKEGDKVLDLGCGNGRLQELFKTNSEQRTVNSEQRTVNNIEYIGVDQSEGLIRIAKERTPGVEFHVAELTQLPFEDNSFDAIYCIAVFCHLPPESHHQALAEMKRVLKPGGKIIMTNWNAFNSWVQNKVTLGKYTTDDQKNFIVPWRSGEKILAYRYYYGFTKKELTELFVQSGFEILENYFTKKGDVVGVQLGENLVSIVRCKT